MHSYKLQLGVTKNSLNIPWLTFLHKYIYNNIWIRILETKICSASIHKTNFSFENTVPKVDGNRLMIATKKKKKKREEE